MRRRLSWEKILTHSCFDIRVEGEVPYFADVRLAGKLQGHNRTQRLVESGYGDGIRAARHRETEG